MRLLHDEAHSVDGTRWHWLVCCYHLPFYHVRVEGWVDLDTVVRVCCIPQWQTHKLWNLISHAQHTGMLPLDYCGLMCNSVVWLFLITEKLSTHLSPTTSQHQAMNTQLVVHATTSTLEHSTRWYAALLMTSLTSSACNWVLAVVVLCY